MARPDPRTLGYVAAWTGAAVVSVTVGLLAVDGVGASVRDRGPLTGEAQAVREAREDDEGGLVPDPNAARVSDEVGGEFGTFRVTCQGAVVFGDDAVPGEGWSVVSYEPGPDDDVDVVFASGDRSVELEVYCNGGVPTVSDREDKTLPDDD